MINHVMYFGLNNTNASNKSNIGTANRVFRWQKHDTPMTDCTFQGRFSESPEEELTTLQYFNIFFKDDILNTMLEKTNLCSVQKSGASVNTDKNKITSFIGIHILMGIVHLQNYKA